MMAFLSKLKFIMIKANNIWQHFNGETAYQSYLNHWQSHHADSNEPLLSRKSFFANETQRKWDGVKRCC
jgi:uncharacterized short protein YbdD (DUF466 family)